MKTKFYFSLMVFALIQFSLSAQLTFTQKFVDTGGNDVTKIAPNNVYRIRFTITNTGSAATDVTLNEAMGAGITNTGNGVINSGSTSPSGTAAKGLAYGWFDTTGTNNPQNETYPSSNSYNWNIGSLAAGATIQFDIQVTTVSTSNPAYPDNTTLSNTASVTDGSGNTVSAAALSGLEWKTKFPNFSSNTTADINPATLCDKVTFTVTLTNSGDGDSDPVTLSAYFPNTGSTQATTMYTLNSASGGGNIYWASWYNQYYVQWSNLTVAAGETKTFTVSATPLNAGSNAAVWSQNSYDWYWWGTSGGNNIFTVNNAYTVTFNSNGGSAVASAEVASGGTATKPADPTKTNFTFDGWYSDAALTTAFDFGAAVTACTTAYAKWSPTTGINNPNSIISVYTKDKQIYVTGVDIRTVKACNASGQAVDITKPLLSGVYFVKIGNKTNKVVVE